jgi:hypothetical protein
MVRLLVLREVGRRGERPFWTAGELCARFPYMAEAKRENIIGHLRERGLLAWDPETSRYSLSKLGRMGISALAVLFRLGDEGSELGYIAGQLAASNVSGHTAREASREFPAAADPLRLIHVAWRPRRLGGFGIYRPQAEVFGGRSDGKAAMR